MSYSWTKKIETNASTIQLKILDKDNLSTDNTAYLYKQKPITIWSSHKLPFFIKININFIPILMQITKKSEANIHIIYKKECYFLLKKQDLKNKLIPYKTAKKKIPFSLWSRSPY